VQQENDDMVKVLLQYATTEQKAALVYALRAKDCAVFKKIVQ
jgi:hypothetical protein